MGTNITRKLTEDGRVQPQWHPSKEDFEETYYMTPEEVKSLLLGNYTFRYRRIDARVTYFKGNNIYCDYNYSISTVRNGELTVEKDNYDPLYQPLDLRGSFSLEIAFPYMHFKENNLDIMATADTALDVFENDNGTIILQFFKAIFDTDLFGRNEFPDHYPIFYAIHNYRNEDFTSEDGKEIIQDFISGQEKYTYERLKMSLKVEIPYIDKGDEGEALWTI
jgi:hypothetical protein